MTKELADPAFRSESNGFIVERAAEVECLETISNRLEELSNLITTVHSGMQAEKTEKQALDCMMCIRYSVRELHKLAEETLRETKEKTNATD